MIHGGATRDLAVDERGCLEQVLVWNGFDVSSVRELLGGSRVMLDSIATVITIAADPHTRGLDVPDGRLPVSALVGDEDSEDGQEILVFMKSGVVDWAELLWYTEDPPSVWPDQRDLREGHPPSR